MEEGFGPPVVMGQIGHGCEKRDSFPLAPALSPGERENVRPIIVSSQAFGLRAHAVVVDDKPLIKPAASESKRIGGYGALSPRERDGVGGKRAFAASRGSDEMAQSAMVS